MARLNFDYNAYGTQVSTLKTYRGQSGWLAVKLISVEALGSLEQHLIVAASTADNSVLIEDDPEKLLRFPATISPSPSQGEGQTPAALTEDLENRKQTLLREINQRNLGYFQQEVEKLDAWADDLKLGLDRKSRKSTARSKRYAVPLPLHRHWMKSSIGKNVNGNLKPSATSYGGSCLIDRMKSNCNGIS